MDAEFRKMLEKAEKIRAECRIIGDIVPHVTHMTKVIRYGIDKKLFGGLFGGNFFKEEAIQATQTTSEENLAQLAESAACVLEVMFNLEAGSMLKASHERRLEIINNALDRINGLVN